jgi:hypothetical protein
VNALNGFKIVGAVYLLPGHQIKTKIAIGAMFIGDIDAAFLTFVIGIVVMGFAF